MTADGTVPRVRKARDEDLPGILRLLRVSLGDISRAGREEYFRWKHRENPFGRSPCLVAESEGAIVAVRIFLRWEFRATGESVRAVRAVDTATAPEWRGRGLFTRLTTELLERCAEQGVRLVFNTPNAASWPGYAKMGWKRVCRVPILLRIRRPIRALLGGSAEKGEPLEATGEKVASVLAGLDPELLEPPGDDAEGRLHTARDLEYLRWRYARVPGIGYRALARATGESPGVIFRLRERRGRRELMICELLLRRGQEEVVSELVREVVQRNRPDYAIAVAARRTPERSALRRAGFLPVPGIGPRFTVRELENEGGRDLSTWSAWRLGLGDLELF